jgi:tRNA pseudouridine55 synthase
VELALTCSAGFYVRTLANDLGRHLGTGAHLVELRRTSSGDLQIADAITLDRIEREPAAVASALIPPARMLTTMPSTALTEEGVRKARHGQTLDDTSITARSSAAARATTRLLDPAGDLIGIAEPGGAPGLLHPVVILV